MNPYARYNGVYCRVSFIDFRRLREDVGIVHTDGLDNMIQVGDWLIGVENVRSIEPIVEGE